jgi:hypothetical protein
LYFSLKFPDVFMDMLTGQYSAEGARTGKPRATPWEQVQRAICPEGAKQTGALYSVMPLQGMMSLGRGPQGGVAALPALGCHISGFQPASWSYPAQLPTQLYIQP